MKCPVCYTKTNQPICPNCGMTIKKEPTPTHIHTHHKIDNSQIIKEEIEKFKTHPHLPKRKMDKGSLKLIIITWVLFGVWGLIFFLQVLRHFF